MLHKTKGKLRRIFIVHRAGNPILVNNPRVPYATHAQPSQVALTKATSCIICGSRGYSRWDLITSEHDFKSGDHTTSALS